METLTEKINGQTDSHLSRKKGQKDKEKERDGQTSLSLDRQEDQISLTGDLQKIRQKIRACLKARAKLLSFHCGGKIFWT